MKITKFLTFAMALGVLFTSCNKDEVTGIEVPPVVAAGEGLLSVSLLDDNGLLTRSGNISELGTEEEREIKSIGFYVYDDQGVCLKSYIPTAIGGSSYTFGVPATTALSVVTVTNMAQADLEGIANANLPMEDLEKYIYDNVIATPTAIPSTGIPMVGQSSTVTIPAGETGATTVVVSRLFARFNAPTFSNTLEVKIEPNTADFDTLKVLFDTDNFIVTADTKIGFQPKGHVVINGLKQSFVMPNYGAAEDALWNPAVWTIGNNLANYTTTVYGTTDDVSAFYSGQGYLTNGQNVYLYENSPLLRTNNETGIEGYDRNSVYSIIVKGELFVDEAGYEDLRATRYWRINVSKEGVSSDSFFKILRNSIYKVEVNNIISAGYGSSEEAEEGGGGEIPGPGSSSIQVNIKVADWKVFAEDTDI